MDVLKIDIQAGMLACFVVVNRVSLNSVYEDYLMWHFSMIIRKIGFKQSFLPQLSLDDTF